jgi:Leucine-rich repeat (LRR) protein
LRKLKKLNLANNKLKNGLKLSEALNGAKNLKTLRLSNNQLLNSFKIDVGRSNKLREVYLDNNRLSSIVITKTLGSKAKERQSQFTILDVSGNQISYFEGFYYLSESLLSLNMASNLLQGISLV